GSRPPRPHRACLRYTPMLDSLNPGQTITCTITKAPKSRGDKKTITRLMKMDPSTARSLRRAQMLRRRNMIVYNRGNRDWYKRSKTARIVAPTIGATWSMPFDHNIARELHAVSGLIKIERA